MKAYIRILDLFPLFSELKTGKALYEIQKEVLFECKVVSSDDIAEIKRKKRDTFSPQTEKNGEQMQESNLCVPQIVFDCSDNTPDLYDALKKSAQYGDRNLENAKNIGEVVSSLPKFYKNYIEEAKNEVKRAERLGAFVVLSTVYYELFGTSLPEFSKTEKGKPCFADNHALFSISHSENLVCIVFYPCAWGINKEKCEKTEKNGEYAPLRRGIGVDIEAKIEKSDEKAQTTAKNVAKRFFTEDENKALECVCKEEFTKEFALLWTRKESLVKMTGEGFSVFKEAVAEASVRSYEIKTKEKEFVLSLSIE